jgi:hypothetical protein
VFDQNGLSLDQAPPIRVVLRFFLVGSLWGIAGGIWLMLAGDLALEPANPEALILTHILTLGVMFSFMLGALFQMLPVLAGIAIQTPDRMAIRTQYPLMAGTFFLLLGFWQGGNVYYILSLFFILVGLLPALMFILSRLQKVATHSASSRGMAHALFNVFILLGLGVILVGLRSGWWGSEYYLQLRLAHMGYGLLGWVALLIVSVAFQVVEMFYVTPPYPRILTRGLTSGITWLLAAALLAGAYSDTLQTLLIVLAMAGLLIHGLITLRRFSQRKRPLTDATVWFWRMSSVALILSMAGGIFQILVPSPVWVGQLTALFFLFFSTAVVLAMAYKIVPFLVWFHLNAQGYFHAPMMHEVIHPKYAMKNLWIHLASLTAALASILYPPAWSLAGGLFAFSFSWLGIGIYRGWHRYLDVERTGEKFSFDFANT